MVDIIIGGAVLPVQNNPKQRDNPRRQAPKKKKAFKDRRKAKTDRRSSVRSGVVVTLSNRCERRKQPDRRVGST